MVTPLPDGHAGPDGHEWAKTEAGYAQVDSMAARADDRARLMWHGWALREAFVAGAEWQEKRREVPDRSWWKEIYRAGIKADLDRQPRTPPEDLTDDQRDVWLSGYDR